MRHNMAMDLADERTNLASFTGSNLGLPNLSSVPFPDFAHNLHHLGQLYLPIVLYAPVFVTHPATTIYQQPQIHESLGLFS